MILFSAFCVLLLRSVFCVDVYNNCSGYPHPQDTFEVLGGHDMAINCSLYVIRKCPNGTPPPHVEGPPVGPPGSLTVDGRLIPDPRRTLSPQITIEWTQHDGNKYPIENLKGYFIRVRKFDVRHKNFTDFCATFDLSETNFQSQDKQLKFRQRWLGFRGGSKFYYRVDVYSLPYTTISDRATMYLTLPPSYKQSVLPAIDWSTSMSFDEINFMQPATLTIKFKMADFNYSFTEYNVDLISTTDKYNYISRCTLSTVNTTVCQDQIYEPPLSNQTTIRVSFHNIMAGRYYMHVQPVDPFPQDDNKCRCSKYSSEIRLCDSCLTSRSPVFTVDLYNNCSGNASLPEKFEVLGVNNIELTCSMYGIEWCGTEIPLPHVEGTPVGQAASLTVDGRLVPGRGRDVGLYPQMVLDWTLRDNYTIEGLKGFLIKIRQYDVDTGNITNYCVSFNLSNTNFHLEVSQLKFIKRLVGFPGGMLFYYRVDVYAQPYTLSHDSATMYFSLPATHNDSDLLPSDWSLFMFYDEINFMEPANLTVNFKMADRSYKFNQYKVQLVTSENTMYAVLSCILDSENSTVCQDQQVYGTPHDNQITMSVMFSNITAGSYFILIQPVDPFPSDESTCLCYKHTSGRCECMLTRSALFTVNVRPPTPYTTPRTPRPDENEHLKVIISSVLGCLAGFILLLVVILIIKKVCTGQIPGIQYDIGGGKEVLVVCAEDHKRHVCATDMFVRFLIDFCKSNVSFLPWEPNLKGKDDKFRWVTDKIETAEIIIVVNSQIGFEQQRNPVESEDVFSSTISHLRAKSEEYFQKYRFIYFDYTDESYFITDICPKPPYKIPDQIPHLLDSIKSTNDDITIQDIISQDILSSKEGIALLEAITKARGFQLSNPDWYKGTLNNRVSLSVSNSLEDIPSISVIHEERIRDPGPRVNEPPVSRDTNNDQLTKNVLEDTGQINIDIEAELHDEKDQHTVVSVVNGLVNNTRQHENTAVTEEGGDIHPQDEEMEKHLVDINIDILPPESVISGTTSEMEKHIVEFNMQSVNRIPVVRYLTSLPENMTNLPLATRQASYAQHAAQHAAPLQGNQPGSDFIPPSESGVSDASTNNLERRLCDIDKQNESRRKDIGSTIPDAVTQDEAGTPTAVNRNTNESSDSCDIQYETNCVSSQKADQPATVKVVTGLPIDLVNGHGEINKNEDDVFSDACSVWTAPSTTYSEVNTSVVMEKLYGINNTENKSGRCSSEDRSNVNCSEACDHIPTDSKIDGSKDNPTDHRSLSITRQDSGFESIREHKGP